MSITKVDKRIPDKVWKHTSWRKGVEFDSWLKRCPIPYDFSHEIENEDDWQLYIYFILDKEVQDE